ncbi:efflux RND transporter periplasmic adaptor subunit [Brucepastera parasyntrophica]|uniref:efflux RND transporter periplasmic adaptor subunit n=1 Tax=Brucepastera parasyntrophica TaxID=2880008 RepID=UPI002108694D|nr:efflux RND transporter periplasmic adaptor subunit [Brucepastera parasyntrophica]ULQ60304.1 efflux RND transporter periplasmic adaptor subunit [Brucepastera parasyntrophica]
MTISRFNVTILAALLGGLFLSGCASKNGANTKNYEYGTITRGSLEKTVSASGSLNPVSTVSVLAQMNGKVEKIYVDYNDEVKKGDILAELNTDMLRLQREQQLASVTKAKANYDLQLIAYQNQVSLAEKNLIADYTLKTSKTDLEVKAAELSAAESSLKAIETEINQYAYITAPIDGIVLEKNISQGQNVVEGSSSNSSSLFTLAEDLREMQIEAGVDELDIKAISPGQNVRFTVESMPSKKFSGIVQKIHFMPATVNNVVTYTVIISVDNKDGMLLPGMTCEVEFIEEQKNNILLAPNSALRYEPSSLSTKEISDMVFNAGLADLSDEEKKAASEARDQAANIEASRNTSNGQTGLTGLVMGGSPMGRGPGGRPPGMPGQNASGNSAADTIVTKNIWYMNDSGKLSVLVVRTGITDGTVTEIISDQNLEGMKIILREKV